VGIAITAALILGGAVSGCSGKEKVAGQSASIVRVTERDFKITAPERVRAGDVEVLARNRGPDDHELIVVRERGARLPFRADGITIDEDALESMQAGALEPGGGGTVRALQLHLTPGRYVLFCNMAGHFLGGMHRTMVVQ
jgi:uncharacterized cupredoxin-like copper-binding protein